MIVQRCLFQQTLEHLAAPGDYGLDTETEGVRTQDQLFSIIIATSTEAFYFNFNRHPDHQGNAASLDARLTPDHLVRLQTLFNSPTHRWYIHNAGFDWGMLRKAGLDIKGPVWCTYAIERVLKNNYMKYSLDACGLRRGMKKDDGVKKYITKHKLYRVETVPGKMNKKKAPLYHKVPFEIMTKYALQDARMHYDIGSAQRKFIELTPELECVAQNELRLTRTLLDMREYGIKIDRNYTRLALDHEMQKITQFQREFQELCHRPYNNSPKHLAECLLSMGEEVGVTAKGNPSLSKDVLATMHTPLAKLVKQIREHQKFIGTYYSSLLYYADTQDILHPNFRQAGTETGRMSMNDPSLHNIPKEEVGEFKVRRCFIPRPGHAYFMLDFDQQEFRMMLDLAGEKQLIDAIMGGVDVHQATADLLQISRKFAKTINFGLLYGMGIEKLAHALGISEVEAQRYRRLYFGKLPRVQRLINDVTQRGKIRGYIFNWLGRRCHIDDPERAYVLPNHLIQGGCADVCKVAMNQVHDYLQGKRSKLVLQVHDELLFEVPPEEYDIVPTLRRIMEDVYTPKHGLKLTCSVEHSLISWADKVSGMPQLATT